MTLVRFTVRAAVYLLCFVLSWYAMSALDFEKLLKKGHTVQAQVLYGLMVIGLAYLAGSFVLSFMYQF